MTHPDKATVERVARLLAEDNAPHAPKLTEYSASWLAKRIAALTAIPNPQGWMPIETAPKDGREIIVGWAEYGSVRGISKAKWATAEFWADLEGGDPKDFEAGWYEPNYEDELCANVWMPLPPPPVQDGSHPND